MRLVKWIWQQHKNFWTKDKIPSLIVTIVIFVLALYIQGIADAYVGSLNAPAVGDLFLQHLPVLNVGFLVIWGAFVITFVSIAIGICQPKYLLFGLKTLALFVIIRSFFISLTHLGIDPNEIKLSAQNFGYPLYNVLFNAQGDFFFSGHTGLPFLTALGLWDRKPWRYFFLVLTVLMGATVLVAHIHYSIDVFAAPFMAYGIFIASKNLFPKDYELIFGQK